MIKSVIERLEKLRTAMKQHNIAAYIIPTADPHLSEYIADHWQFRKWLSGFTGSAGTLLVTETEAGLWTDSRYFLQGEEQLQGSGIKLFKDGLPETPKLVTYICRTLQNKNIGLDGCLFSASAVENMSVVFNALNIKLQSDVQLDGIWSDCPALPNSEVFVHDVKFNGKSAADKLTAIRQQMQKRRATHCLISALDEVAYTLNLRGGDVDYNPVFYAYLLVSDKDATLYSESKDADGRHLMGSKVADYLKENDVAIKPYDSITADLSALKSIPNLRVMLNKGCTNSTLVSALPANSVVNADSPVSMMKAVKNETEISNLRKAQLVDGVALTKAFCWLDARIAAGDKVTELSFADYLDARRAEQNDYYSLSFNTISGFAHHGAIVHYGVTPETDIELKKGNLLLVDSGGNYLTGTTDITRTVLLGDEAPAEMKRDFTLVLMGHISLAMAKFPAGTTGTQLDVLAKQYLWQSGKNFGHGTGHGIGHFLCVHEGPQRISSAVNTVALQPGMFISNEPGLYVTGKYGIRHENMVCVQPFTQTDFGTFYQFETMSYFPFDVNAIEVSMLSAEQRDWLNEYHAETYRRIAGTGLLTEEENNWLKNKTRKI